MKVKEPCKKYYTKNLFRTILEDVIIADMFMKLFAMYLSITVFLVTLNNSR